MADAFHDGYARLSARRTQLETRRESMLQQLAQVDSDIKENKAAFFVSPIFAKDTRQHTNEALGTRTRLCRFRSGLAAFSAIH